MEEASGGGNMEEASGGGNMEEGEGDIGEAQLTWEVGTFRGLLTGDSPPAPLSPEIWLLFYKQTQHFVAVPLNNANIAEI